MTHVRQMIDIIETVYRGASKGRGLVVAPKGGCSILTEGTCGSSTVARLFDAVQVLGVSRDMVWRGGACMAVLYRSCMTSSIIYFAWLHCSFRPGYIDCLVE